MRSRGLALVSVLWVLTLLSLIAASFTNTTRTEVNLARNEAESARAEAMADAGVNAAILGLLTNNPQREWRVDGTVYAWRFENGELRANAWDEGGKIDLNVGSEAILRSLFEAVGVDSDKAAALVDAIVDFRDPNDLRQLNGAEDRDYRDAGLPYGAKDAPFETIDELRQVLGMTPALFDAVEPAVTIYGRQRTPFEPTASPLVKAALSGAVLDEGGGQIPDQGLDQIPDQPDNDSGATVGDDSATPDADLGTTPTNQSGDAPVVRSQAGVFTVHVEARTDTGAVFARDAVVEIGTAAALPFQVWSWRQGRRELFETPKPAQ